MFREFTVCARFNPPHLFFPRRSALAACVGSVLILLVSLFMCICAALTSTSHIQSRYAATFVKFRARAPVGFKQPSALFSFALVSFIQLKLIV